MNTIDDKIELFNKLIFEKLYTEKKIEIDKFNKEKEEILNREKEKHERKRNLFIDDVNKAAAIKKKEIIAKEGIEVQQRLLVLKRELLKETMEALKIRVKEFTNTEDYKKFLFQLIEQSKDMLEDKDYILSLTAEDKEKYGDEIKQALSEKVKGNIKVKSSEQDMLGGLIIEEAEGSYRINNTLLSKIDETREYAGLILTDLLG